MSRLLLNTAAMATRQLNVMQKPLGLFSKDPMTGFYRDGYCRTGPEDQGNHSVAATVTDAFLDFSASRGNNLRSIGLTGGCKWCLCVNRWKEAIDAATSGSGISKDQVPKVHLHATNQRALEGVSMEDLKKFAAEPETGNGGNTEIPQSRKGGLGGAVKERTELANKGEMTSRD